MNIYTDYILQVCEDITRRLNLHIERKRVTIIYDDNNPHQISKWVIIDRVGFIIKKYNDLGELIEDYKSQINE